jgi:hypothetical protein
VYVYLFLSLSLSVSLSVFLFSSLSRPPAPLSLTHTSRTHTLAHHCRSFALEALEQVSPGVREQLAARLLQAPPPAPDADYSPAAAAADGVEALGCRDEEALRDVALALLRDQVPPWR